VFKGNGEWYELVLFHERDELQAYRGGKGWKSVILAMILVGKV
jgi:hypothetical protein